MNYRRHSSLYALRRILAELEQAMKIARNVSKDEK